MPANAVAIIGAAAGEHVPAPLQELRELAAVAAEYAGEAAAPNTRRAYAADLADFTSWCAGHGARFDLAAGAAASADAVALYLAARAPRLSVATLERRLAGIRAAHRAVDLAPPQSARLAAVWAGIRRSHGRPPEKKRALVIEDLRSAIGKLPPGLKGSRDRALLLTGFASGLRRSELVKVDVGAATARDRHGTEFTPRGLIISLGATKTDQEAAGAAIAILNGKTKLCPVRALQAWLAAAEITAGAAFRAIDRHGRVSAEGLSDRAVALIVKAAAEGAGLDPDVFGGHSLRSGLATTAFDRDVALETTMRQLRHRKADTTIGYAQASDLFRRNVSGKVGL